MIIAGIILCSLGLALFITSTVLLIKDLRPGYGYTMGGEMLFSHLWLAGACLAATGIGLLPLMDWYFSIPIAIAIFLISFPWRGFIQKHAP